MNDKFQILMMRSSIGSGDILGYCDLQVGRIRIKGIKIIKNEDGIFCAMPSEKFFSKVAGRLINRAVVILEDDFRSTVYDAILEKWNELEGLKFKNDEERGEDR